jgi:hypothetical protein
MKMSLQSDLLAAISELGNEMRKRRDMEYTYAAACVAGFGAIAWGMATLLAVLIDRQIAQSLVPVRWATVAAIVGTLGVAVFVMGKIWREHKFHEDARKGQKELAQSLGKEKGYEVIARTLGTSLRVNENCMGCFLLKVGSGYIWSMMIVGFSAIVPVGFCVAVLIYSCQ